MSENTEIDRRLTEIRDEIRDVKRLLIGGHGDEGALDRLTKVESRQGFITTCYLWVAFVVAGLAAMVVPGYFKHQQ